MNPFEPSLIELRRDFHRHPETAWTEVYTSCRIAEELNALGYEVLVGRQVCNADSRMGLPAPDVLNAAVDRAVKWGAPAPLAEQMRGGFTGVIGILRCGEGPTIALRFDIDALPVLENTADHFPAACGFRSVHEGCMHACGHDGHITVGLGTAAALAAARECLHGTVKLIFQPAEEGVRGAASVAAKGHLTGVDYLLGAHMGGTPDCKQPHLYLDSGRTMATEKLDAVFTGAAAHAGEAPQEGRSAMLAAASAVLNLNSIPRYAGAQTRINVGTIHGGTGRNVICDHVKLELEVRGSTAAANDYMSSYARRVLQASADMHGCGLELTKQGSADCTPNTPSLSGALAEGWRAQGLPVVTDYGSDWSVSEDFSTLARAVSEDGGQVCYFHIYSRCPQGLHKSGFDFQEEALPLGVKAFTSAVQLLVGCIP